MEKRKKLSDRKGRLYSLDDLWKLERQLDAIANHSRIALSIVRKAIKERDGYRARLYKPPQQSTLKDLKGQKGESLSGGV